MSSLAFHICSTPDCIRQASSTSFGKSPKLPKLQITIYTLKKVWVVFGYNSSLSKRWVCCVVKNLSRFFLSEWPPILLWVMRVYIVWMKGKKVILKILQAESFMSISRVGPSRETLAKLTTWHDSSASSMCFSHDSFTGRLLLRHSRNPLVHPIHAQFFTNLILKPIQ